MTLLQRIEAFTTLGNKLSSYVNSYKKDKKQIDNTTEYEAFVSIVEKVQHHNGWFTQENVIFAMENWGTALTSAGLNTWLKNYTIPDTTAAKTVKIIMAGNIPLVGFHDFISCLITGHNVKVKLSSNDDLLLPYVADLLIEIAPSFKDCISFSDKIDKHFDAVIATGSTNTARYFEYYFSKKPNIIRKNRNSIAVLTGEESNEELAALAEDIFRYYGLGCRSVSKLFVPVAYNFDAFFNAIFIYQDIIKQAKYANNYDYNKAVYLMSEFKLLDNGFLMLKEEEKFGSPIATLFYETYPTSEELAKVINNKKEDIQCIVGRDSAIASVNFGETQHPSLSDYADGVDTIEFLLKI